MTDAKTQNSMLYKTWTVPRKKEHVTDTPLAITTSYAHTVSVYKAADGITETQVHATAMNALSFNIKGVFA